MNIRLNRLVFFPLCVILLAMSARAQCCMKNVIIMIADGWGYNQIQIAEYYNGISPPYKAFPIRLAMSTYSYDGWGYDPEQAWADFGYLMMRYTDSAAAASAMSTGVKIHDDEINIDPMTGEPLLTTLQRAEELGKATGVITSVEWSHATPAGWVAHNPSRGDYIGIAREMLASDVEVIMGCGHPWYNDNAVEILPHPRAGASYQYVGDSLHWMGLINGTLGWTLIQDSMAFVNLAADPNPPIKVCGTAKCRTTLQQARTPGEAGNSFTPPYNVPQNRGVPRLKDEALAALNVLKYADIANNGIFLMIEGGAVDWANHANQAGRMIEELNDFNKTVQAVIEWIEANSNWNETLLIVTGDHETGYLWGPDSGYPAVWNPIVDNGPGVMPGGLYYSGSHTNSLIPLFAKGAGAPWFELWAARTDPMRGSFIDNTDIARLMFGYFDCTLDVDLASFTASVVADGVELRWVTASEKDNERFEILRENHLLAEIPSQGDSPTGYSYEWTDFYPTNDRELVYTLATVDVNGARVDLARAMVSTSAPIEHAGQYALWQNYPNPFNASTNIRFILTEPGFVTLQVYDVGGRRVATLVRQYLDAGVQEVVFGGGNLASGVYFYSLETGAFTAHKKMLLLK